MIRIAMSAICHSPGQEDGADSEQSQRAQQEDDRQGTREAWTDSNGQPERITVHVARLAALDIRDSAVDRAISVQRCHLGGAGRMPAAPGSDPRLNLPPLAAVRLKGVG